MRKVICSDFLGSGYASGCVPPRKTRQQIIECCLLTRLYSFMPHYTPKQSDIAKQWRHGRRVWADMTYNLPTSKFRAKSGKAVRKAINRANWKKTLCWNPALDNVTTIA